MEDALRALLTGDAGLTALAPATSISWDEAKQGTPLPVIVLTLINGAEGFTQQGPDGLWQGRVQIDCDAATAKQAIALAGEVEAILNGYRGGRFEGIFLDARRSGFDEAGVNRARRQTLDFIINWRARDAD